MEIQPTTRDDIPGLKTVLDATGLFPTELLPDMIRGYLADAEAGDIWLTGTVDAKPVCFLYAIPETLTDRTWNLLAIAVLPQVQGTGLGGAMVTHLEKVLVARRQRLLLVETSGGPEFEQTRAFYRKIGFGEEGRIRDFYAAGDDKIIFRKALA